jgi:hypothetical protein
MGKIVRFVGTYYLHIQVSFNALVPTYQTTLCPKPERHNMMY